MVIISVLLSQLLLSLQFLAFSMVVSAQRAQSLCPIKITQWSPPQLGLPQARGWALSPNPSIHIPLGLSILEALSFLLVHSLAQSPLFTVSTLIFLQEAPLSIIAHPLSPVGQVPYLSMSCLLLLSYHCSLSSSQISFLSMIPLILPSLLLFLSLLLIKHSQLPSPNPVRYNLASLLAIVTFS